MMSYRWFPLMVLFALVSCRSTDKTPEAKPPARAPEPAAPTPEPVAPSPEPVAPTPVPVAPSPEPAAEKPATPPAAALVKTPDEPPDAAPAAPAAAPQPPSMTDAELACKQDGDCVLANVWEWEERTGGYCNTCDVIAMNRTAAARFEKWYYAHHGKNCAKLNCAPLGPLASHCVQSRCVQVESEAPTR